MIRAGNLYPDWTEHAVCRDGSVNSTIDFYVVSQASVARQACLRCPVRRECLSHAIDNNEEHGVWGGLGPMARKALKRKRMRRGCPGCESTSLRLLRPHQICRACGLSWEVEGAELPPRKSVHARTIAAFEQQSA